ncbi:2539_t:CDS:2, partial [Funneliformis geosporum]
LMQIIREVTFYEFTHHENSVKPFWCILTDGGLDENLRFLANILNAEVGIKKQDAIEDNCIKVSVSSNIINDDSQKQKKNITKLRKIAKLWEQDHLTFKINDFKN